MPATVANRCIINPMARVFWLWCRPIFSPRGCICWMSPRLRCLPQRQLTLLLEIYRLAQAHAQFILVTHSPILLGLPGAELLSLDGNALRPIAYTDTESYQVTRMFIEQREGLLKKLLEE